MSTINEILRSSLKDEDEQVRNAAAEAIARYEIRERFDALKELVEKGEKIEKLRAIYTLGKLKGESVTLLIAKATKDPIEDVRATAIRALGSMGDMRTINILLKSLEDESHVVQRAAVDALGSFKDRKLTVPFMKMLRNSDRGVIERALEALGRLGDKKAEEALAYFAVKGTPAMRALAVRSLGNLEL